MRNLALNMTLLLITCLIGLVFCELFLRSFYPKYEAAAEAEYDLDEFRIWKRVPYSKGTLEHPDTGLRHSLNYNNFGFRQDRDFSEQEIELNTNIGFFGDSWTENVRMAVQYSFTEPLDYLLNHADEGKGVNILNFGVDGYGTGQTFLHYNSFQYKKNLDYVFYVYSNNDIRNIYETNLFRIDDKDNLLQNVPSPPYWWVTFVSKLHISYLLLDIAQQLSIVTPESPIVMSEDVQREVEQGMKELHTERSESAMAEAIYQNTKNEIVFDENMRDHIDIFKRIVFTWRELVKENEGKFYVVILPAHFQDNDISGLKENFETINLDHCFSEHDSEYSSAHWEDSPYRFNNDGHWNEAGNRLAAVCLYRFLEQEMDLPSISENDLQDALERYYSAFEEAGHTGDPEQEMIRARYSALSLAQEAE